MGSESTPRKTDEIRLVVESQPRLYIEAMMEDYDQARMADAKEAILTRLGAVLLSTYGVTPTLRDITTEPWKPKARYEKVSFDVSWKPEPPTLRHLVDKLWWRTQKRERAS